MTKSAQHYAVMDLSESLGRVEIGRKDIKTVLFAWGSATGMGDPKDSRSCVTEWAGGFVLLLKNGRVACLTGWNDYTGWGCQDGAKLLTTDELSYRDMVKWSWVKKYCEIKDVTYPDRKPVDLNRWIRGEIKL